VALQSGIVVGKKSVDIVPQERVVGMSRGGVSLESCGRAFEEALFIGCKEVRGVERDPSKEEGRKGLRGAVLGRRKKEILPRRKRGGGEVLGKMGNLRHGSSLQRKGLGQESSEKEVLQEGGGPPQ